MAAFDGNAYARRLILARMRLLNDHGFFGLLLMHARFALDSSLSTAATDGDKIYFSPAFMDELSDGELDFVLMHEILHIALGHCRRSEGLDEHMFNIACDIVVNSNIMRSRGGDEKSITIKKYGVSMHTAPDGKEGDIYTAEQVYAMLVSRERPGGKRGERAKSVNGKKGDSLSVAPVGEGIFDCHDRWAANASAEADWQLHVVNAAEAIKARAAGGLPLGIERLVKKIKNPQVDWRTALTDFVQDEVCDYTFAPPDRRYDGDFFLPDYNERDESVRNVLFMVDTSGSMTDDMISAVFSELYGAVEQFGGRLSGRIGFFDAKVTPPVPFEDAGELKSIIPRGGGGTSFRAVFDYVRDNMADDLPASMIVMTDGKAKFPAESAALGVPTLWLLINDKVTPPWGRTVRIEP